MLGLKLEKVSYGASCFDSAVRGILGQVRKTGLHQHVGYRGFFSETPHILFGKVHSPAAFKAPLRAAKAACGTV